MSSLLITERSGGVLTLRFNRPDKFNSFVREIALAVQDAQMRLETMPKSVPFALLVMERLFVRVKILWRLQQQMARA